MTDFPRKFIEEAASELSNILGDREPKLKSALTGLLKRQDIEFINYHDSYNPSGETKVMIDKIKSDPEIKKLSENLTRIATENYEKEPRTALFAGLLDNKICDSRLLLSHVQRFHQKNIEDFIELADSMKDRKPAIAMELFGMLGCEALSKSPLNEGVANKALKGILYIVNKNQDINPGITLEAIEYVSIGYFNCLFGKILDKENIYNYFNASVKFAQNWQNKDPALSLKAFEALSHYSQTGYYGYVYNNSKEKWKEFTQKIVKTKMDIAENNLEKNPGISLRSLESLLLEDSITHHKTNDVIKLLSKNPETGFDRKKVVDMILRLKKNNPELELFAGAVKGFLPAEFKPKDDKKPKTTLNHGKWTIVGNVLGLFSDKAKQSFNKAWFGQGK